MVDTKYATEKEKQDYLSDRSISLQFSHKSADKSRIWNLNLSKIKRTPSKCITNTPPSQKGPVKDKLSYDSIVHTILSKIVLKR